MIGEGTWGREGDVGEGGRRRKESEINGAGRAFIRIPWAIYL